MDYKFRLLFLLTGLLFLIPGFSTLAVAQVSFGEPVKISDHWKFTLADVEGGQKAVYNDEEWQTVDLPHDWSVEQPLSPTLASAMGYLPGGIAWYRKTIEIPEEKKDKKVFLYFEGVYNRSEVYINGHLLGKRPNGYISFLYDATPYIKAGEKNVIAVRVDHSREADSRWYTGSGIYRDVYMVYANPVHIAQWGIFAYPEIKRGENGTLHVEVRLKNESSKNSTLTIKQELLSPKGKIAGKNTEKLAVAAGQEEKFNAKIKVNNPQLWSIGSPDLYLLKTSVFKDGKLIDETTTPTGFRSLTFDPDKGFALNDNWMKIKGVCLHHDAGVLGAAVPREVWKRRLLTLKEIGVNAIRTSHNPQAPDLYELCDELGLLVMNEAFDEWEFPKRKWLEGWNVGTPGYEGSFDFFEEWGEKDLADMVRRDRNHISIFAWSIGNEVDYPNDPYSHPVLGGIKEEGGFTQAIYGGYKKDAPDAMRLGAIAEELVAVVKKYDASRPVTAGLAGVAMSNETAYPSALDITGYNYTESRYLTDHEKYPGRVIFGSENRHDIDAWKAVVENDHIFGQFLWTGIDYLGESGRWPSRGFYSGLLDFGGFIKPRGYFRQSLWSDQPMAYIGTYPAKDSEKSNRLSIDAWPIWNYEEDQIIRVVSYTNAAKARLELNGEVVGETKPYDSETGIIHWDIPYRKGELTVIGLDKNNKEVATYTIESSGAPHAITITEGEQDLKEGGVAQIVIQVVDENGTPVMLADNLVKCEVEGPAQLLGLEASNNRDMTDYTDNVHRVFHGKMLAYIKATGETGTVKVKFTSPWLESAETTIVVK